MDLAGVILDWAGTVVDHGSRAPVAALQEIFANSGVAITVEEARASMGLAKRMHIAAILELPRIRAQWTDQHGSFPTAADVDELYAAFIPRQLDGLKCHAEVIAGIPEAVERMRAAGLAIGSTTGYTRPMLDFLLARALEQNFRPDAALCPDDVPQGRPAPWMCYRNAIQLGIYPMWSMVKIGDTPVDMEEGLNAGMWTIGITRTGNQVGLTSQEWECLSDSEQHASLRVAEEQLMAAGAHYTAASVSECHDILEEISGRLNHSEYPWQRNLTNAAAQN